MYRPRIRTDGGGAGQSSPARQQPIRRSGVLAAPAWTAGLQVQRAPIGPTPATTPATTPAATPAAAPGEMTWDDFRHTMLRRYGVAEIRVGTFEEQASRLPAPGGNPPPGFARATWQQFDPGPSSPLYTWIVQAFEDFEQSIGGVPPVHTILFFDMHYEAPQPPAPQVATPDPDTGASFGAGELVVYRGVTRLNKGLPMARSNPQGHYPGSPTLGLGGPGSSPGAPIPAPSREESANAMIVHELGHGLTEAAHRADPNVFDAYKQAVGWIGSPPRLYDIGAQTVQQALQQGTAPPAALEITVNHWNDPRWVEQPLSDYMVAGGPSEDFAEAVLAYVRDPALLRSRSPRRHAFIQGRIELWRTQLLVRPPVGDFPLPREHYA